MISGIVLASGFSRRFGKDKLLQKINSETIIEKTIKNCIESNLNEIIVVFRNKEVHDLLENFELKLVSNHNAGKGMSESIKIGISNICKEAEGVMIIMGDQPLFLSEDINKLIEVFIKENKIVVASIEGKRRNPVIFPKKYFQKLLLVEGDKGGRNIVEKNENPKILVEYSKEKLMDIDFPSDLDKFKI
jgi:molybdenum cofactor cytidylyltransferase